MKCISAYIHQQRVWFPIAVFLCFFLYPWQNMVCFAFENKSSIGQEADSGQMRIVGATTIQPVVQGVVHLYLDYSGIEVEPFGGGSSFGISSVRDKTADIGMVSRELTPEEKEEFGHATVGYDAVAVIVNSFNPKQSITRKELRDIYTCRTKTWPEGLEGHNDTVLISKMVGRGTLSAFESYIGLVSPFHPDSPHQGQETICTSAWEAGANLDSTLWVGGIRGAIGYVSAGDARRFIRLGVPIRILEVDGSKPVYDVVSRGRYPLSRELNLVFLSGNDRAE